MFTLGVTLRVKKGKEGELIETMRDAAAKVRENEKDTVAYKVFRNMKDPLQFFFFEQYTNRESWEQVHNGMPYIKKAVQKLSGLTEGELEITEYESIV
ncbi:MAG: antibiotic biosynthesis monooxygenase [Spirochaetes bacterium]|nr:antibiotic biosynthesis monooxygenase [Spirochaetota bacterium]